MTARRRLLPMDELREALDTLASYGVDVSRCDIDIGAEEVRVRRPVESSQGAGAYDTWKAKDKGSDPAPRRQ